MTTSTCTPTATVTPLADMFLRAHLEYLFQDAHFFVEASAKAESQEIAPNVFEFNDHSVLHIQKEMGAARVYPSRDQFLNATRR